MYVTDIAVNGFKNLENVSIKPHSEYNLITGKNAQGKTNLLEAVWLKMCIRDRIYAVSKL